MAHPEWLVDMIGTSSGAVERSCHVEYDLPDSLSSDSNPQDVDLG